MISDIVCDEAPTDKILNDPELWSGCIAGAFRENEFLEMFEQAGFYGIEILARQTEPWQVIDGVEFRSLTVQAFKGKEGECLERNQAVIYRGPWKSVQDDDGHTLYRGERMAVCDKTFQIYTNPTGAYHSEIIAIAPYEEIPYESAASMPCTDDPIRDPRQTKGSNYRVTTESEDCCSPQSCC